MAIQIITKNIDFQELKNVAVQTFGEWLKAVVDIEREVMAIGGEMHADEEAMLLAEGSREEDVWGINLFPDRAEPNWVEFNSMINIRPSRGNHTRNVEDPVIREKIRAIVRTLVIR